MPCGSVASSVTEVTKEGQPLGIRVEFVRDKCIVLARRPGASGYLGGVWVLEASGFLVLSRFVVGVLFKALCVPCVNASRVPKAVTQGAIPSWQLDLD